MSLISLKLRTEENTLTRIDPEVSIMSNENNEPLLNSRRKNLLTIFPRMTLLLEISKDTKMSSKMAEIYFRNSLTYIVPAVSDIIVTTSAIGKTGMEAELGPAGFKAAVKSK